MGPRDMRTVHRQWASVLRRSTVRALLAQAKVTDRFGGAEVVGHQRARETARGNELLTGAAGTNTTQPAMLCFGQDFRAAHDAVR